MPAPKKKPAAKKPAAKAKRAPKKTGPDVELLTDDPADFADDEDGDEEDEATRDLPTDSYDEARDDYVDLPEGGVPE